MLQRKLERLDCEFDAALDTATHLGSAVLNQTLQYKRSMFLDVLLCSVAHCIAFNCCYRHSNRDWASVYRNVEQLSRKAQDMHVSPYTPPMRASGPLGLVISHMLCEADGDAQKGVL